MTIRLLIHPRNDGNLFETVAGVLESAVTRHPDTFDKVKDQPATVDHYGYHTDELSAVVLSQEYQSQFWRLTIRPGEHPVFDNLAAIITERLNGDAS